MNRYKCIICGYIYDPVDNNNIEFESLRDDWTCPDCGAGKDQFKLLEE